MSGGELDSIMDHWPAVIRECQRDAWSRDFTRSIAARARNPGWRPTRKQARLMRKAVAELFAGEATLIEEEELE